MSGSGSKHDGSAPLPHISPRRRLLPTRIEAYARQAMTCVECGVVADAHAFGWRAYRAAIEDEDASTGCLPGQAGTPRTRAYSDTLGGHPNTDRADASH